MSTSEIILAEKPILPVFQFKPQALQLRDAALAGASLILLDTYHEPVSRPFEYAFVKHLRAIRLDRRHHARVRCEVAGHRLEQPVREELLVSAEARSLQLSLEPERCREVRQLARNEEDRVREADGL